MIDDLFSDPAPDILVGDFVQAKTTIFDGEFLVAEQGDVGTVVLKDVGPEFGYCLPTVRFERTGALFDVLPEEVDVLAPGGFAADQKTTPKRALKFAIKRGKS